MTAENPHLYPSENFRSDPQSSLSPEPLPSGKSLYRPDTTLILGETHHDTRYPSIVVKQTRTALELYATGETPDSTPITSYLRDYTLPFLDQTICAIPLKFSRASDYAGVKDQKTLRFLMNKTKDLENPQLGIQSLEVALAIFDEIPEKYELPPVLEGFSQKGYFPPPRTVTQLYSRLQEIRATIRSIATHTSSQSPTGTPYFARLRTHAFFHVGAAMSFI